MTATPKTIYNSALAGGQIRLLKVQAGSSNTGQRTWSLREVSLDTGPAYHALSYTWSDGSKDTTVRINDIDFSVTHNLSKALNTLAKASDDFIWADAICINQEDNTEKSIQVAQMGKVYENARRVQIWLGDTDEESDTAFKLLNGFGSPKNMLVFAETVLASYISGEYTSGWAALAQVLARPWWTRAWIFQEVLLAKSAEVWCGNDHCSWNTFAAVAKVVEQFRSKFVLGSDQDAVSKVMTRTHHLYNLVLYQKQRRLNCPPSFSEALQVRRQAGAKDPRDKVYSLLAACREEEAVPRGMRSGKARPYGSMPPTPSGRHLRISYHDGHTVADVYQGAALHIISKSKHLDILSACQNPNRANNIPSWAPDWSIPRETNPIVSPDDWGRIYRASGETPAFQYRSDPGSDELVVQAMYVDTIAQVGSPRPPTVLWHQVQPEWWQFALACGKTGPDGNVLKVGDFSSDPQSVYLDGETVEDAFLRTCVMDRIPEFRHEPHTLIDRSGMSEELKVREIMARLNAIESRRFAVTRCAFMGLFPTETQKGDMVYGLLGADVPFVVRHVDGVGNVLVGECYVHGIMNGETVEGKLGLPGRDGNGLRLEELVLK